MQILHALTDFASTGTGRVKRLKLSGDLRLRVGNYRVRFEGTWDGSYRILQVRKREDACRT